MLQSIPLFYITNNFIITCSWLHETYWGSSHWSQAKRRWLLEEKTWHVLKRHFISLLPKHLLPRRCVCSSANCKDEVAVGCSVSYLHHCRLWTLCKRMEKQSHISSKIYQNAIIDLSNFSCSLTVLLKILMIAMPVVIWAHTAGGHSKGSSKNWTTYKDWEPMQYGYHPYLCRQMVDITDTGSRTSLRLILILVQSKILRTWLMLVTVKTFGSCLMCKCMGTCSLLISLLGLVIMLVIRTTMIGQILQSLFHSTTSRIITVIAS